MNEPLTVEQRRKVADEVTQKPHMIATSGDIIIVAYDQFGNRNFVDSWDPEESIDQRYALTRTVAQMIVAASPADWVDLSTAFIEALAENNTPEIERMAWELLEGK